MAVNLQPTYTTTQPIALPGMPATEHGWDADTYIVDKNAVAKIGFGIAVQALTPATLANTVVIGAASDAVFLGVTYRDITQPPRSPEGYAAGENIAVMTRGDIWVTVGGVGAINPGAAVKVIAATGVFDAAGTITITGAQWMRGAAAGGLALLRLNRPI